jgi:hypothetical protein
MNARRVVKECNMKRDVRKLPGNRQKAAAP